jgi:ATP-dependent helicase/nuclease subunit B
VAALAATLDVPPGASVPVDKPCPAPPLAARPDRISVTGVDQLARDPFAFYAAKILRLSELDPLSSGPDAKWFGTRVHKFLQDWQAAGLTGEAFETELAALRADPALDSLASAFWLPRIEPSLRWAAERIWASRDERWPVANEVGGKAMVDGILLHGTADRVDQTVDGTLAIVDYKTGAAPSAKSTGDGLNSQLGLLGLLAETAGLGDLAPENVDAFEYWELKRDRKKGVEGAVKVIRGQKPGPATAAAVVARAREALAELSARYLSGHEPFVPGDTGKRYADFDQLMRRDEWFGRGDFDRAAHDEAPA